jgi:hypothetical protein
MRKPCESDRDCSRWEWAFVLVGLAAFAFYLLWTMEDLV